MHTLRPVSRFGSIVIGLLCGAVLAAAPAHAQQVEQLTSSGNHYHPSLNDGRVAWVGWDGDSYEIMISNIEQPVVVIDTLTDNGGEKEHPSSVGSSRIVWQGRASGGADWEIWLYDRETIPRFRQFTDNTVPDRYPSVGVGGNFAWASGQPIFESIHYWNEAAASESVISNACCPIATHSNEAPSYNEYGVVWRSIDRSGGGNRFQYWNGATTELSIPDGSDPSLYGETVAYVGLVGLDRRILYWNEQTIQQITDYEGFAPSLYDSRIAYERWDGHDWEIEYWDGAEIWAITDNDFDDTQPSLHGTSVAWLGRPESLNQIFYATALPVPEPSPTWMRAVVLAMIVVVRRVHANRAPGAGTGR